MRTNRRARRALTVMTIILAGALLAGALLVQPVAAQSATTFRVTITNNTDPEMIITPGAWLVHQESGEFWSDGGSANLALERIAEIGVPEAAVNDLGATALDAIPANGDSITFEFNASSGLFSFAQMLIATNDSFVGVNAIPLFGSDGAPTEITVDLLAWDAGTEENADLFAGFDAGQPDPDRGEANLDNGTATSEPISVNDQFGGPQGTLTITPIVVLPSTGTGGLADGGGGFPTWAIALAAAAATVVAAATARVALDRR